MREVTKLVRKTTRAKEEGRKGVKSGAGHDGERKTRRERGQQKGVKEKSANFRGSVPRHWTEGAGKDGSPLSCFLVLLQPNGREAC